MNLNSSVLFILKIILLPQSCSKPLEHQEPHFVNNRHNYSLIPYTRETICSVFMLVKIGFGADVTLAQKYRIMRDN